MVLPTTYTNQPSLDLEVGSGRDKAERRSLLTSTASSFEPQHEQDNGISSTAAEADKATLQSSSKEASSRFIVGGAGIGLKEISAVLLYSFCSVSMILVNKSLASSYNHLIETGEGGKADLNTLLVIFQAVSAVVFVWGCKMVNLLEPNTTDLKWSVVQSWAPVNIFFCLMLFTSMAALQTNSVPMVTIFKNVANITTATADYFLFGNQLETLSIAAFAVMLTGAIFAAWNNMETSMAGFFWMLFNCVSTTGYVCYMRYATQSIKMTKFGMVYVNNVLCVIFLVPVAILKGEIATFLHSRALHTLDYGFKNLFAGFVGFFLNAASLNCVSVTGPTTYAIVGSLNKVPVTFLGYFMFNDKLSQQTWLFVCVSLVGGFLYTYAKLQRKPEKKQADDTNLEVNSRK